MRVLRITADEIWLGLEPEALAAASRHLTHVLGRPRGDDRGRTRPRLALLSSRARRRRAGRLASARRRARPRARRGRRHRACGDPHRPGARPGASRSGSRTRCVEALAGARESPRSTEDALEIVRVESGRPRFGREMTTGDDPAGSGDQRARRQLHQGVLHRPGDGRPPALQGQAEPPPAGSAPLRARARRRHGRGSASANWDGSAPPCSPPPTGRSRSRSSAARPSRAHRRGRRRTARARQSTPRWWTCPSTGDGDASIRVPRGDEVPGGRNGMRGFRSARSARSPCAAVRARRCGEDDFAERSAPAKPGRADRGDRRPAASASRPASSAPGWSSITISNQTEEPTRLTLDGPTTPPPARSRPAAPAAIKAAPRGGRLRGVRRRRRPAIKPAKLTSARAPESRRTTCCCRS